MREDPPRIGFAPQGIFVRAWPHPRRVTDLKIEATAGEHGGEVEFPVEEALGCGGVVADAQPRMVCNGLVDVARPGEGQVEVFGVVDCRPGGVGAELDGGALPRIQACLLAEDRLKGVEPLVEAGRFDLLAVDGGGFGVHRPKPQRTPRVHHPAQTPKRAVGIGERGFHLGTRNRVERKFRAGTPNVDGAADLVFGDLHASQRELPQRFHPRRQRHQPRDLRLRRLERDLFPPGVQRFLRRPNIGFEFFGLAGRTPSARRHKEVVDAPRRGRVCAARVGNRSKPRKRCILWLRIHPFLVDDLVGGIRRAARTDERIAAAQVQTEPRCGQPRSHRVQPQRNLGELHRGLVEVHPINLVQSQVGLDFLQLGGALFGVDVSAEFLLAQLQIQLGELAHGLHGERPGTHCWFADSQAEDVFGAANRPGLLQLLNSLLHNKSREHLRGVEGGGAFAVAAGLAEHERPSRMHQPHIFAGFPVFAGDAILGFHLQRVLPVNHPRTFRGITVFGDFPQILGGDKTGVGHQPLIHLAQFCDAKCGIGNEPAILAGLLRGDKQVL